MDRWKDTAQWSAGDHLNAIGKEWPSVGTSRTRAFVMGRYDSADVLGRGGDGTINRDEVRPRECEMVLEGQNMAQGSCGGSRIRATLRWERVEYPRGFGVWCSRQMRAVVVEGKYDGVALAMDGIPEMMVARSRVVVRKSLRELRKGWGDVGGKRVPLLRQERWATTAVMEITNVAKLTAAPHFRPQPRPHPAKHRLLTGLCHHPRHLQGAQATRRCVPGQLPCWELSKLQPPAPCPATKRQPKAANPQPSAPTIESRS